MDPQLHHWAHVRGHAAEGGLYATCLAELCDHVTEETKSAADCIIDLRRSVQLLVDALANVGERLKALEAGPEVQELPTSPQEGGPTLLAPIQLQQGAEPDEGLVDEVAQAISTAYVEGENEACAAITAVAKWLLRRHDEDEVVHTVWEGAKWLEREVAGG